MIPNDTRQLSVLFVNHSVLNCGVYQYGKRLFDVLHQHDTCNEFVYIEVRHIGEYFDGVKAYSSTIQNGSGIILYNYHDSTMPWLSRAVMEPNMKHIGIPHESTRDIFDSIIDIDPCSGTETSIPRPLLEWNGNGSDIVYRRSEVKEFIEYGNGGDVPVFGSFGFGFDNKGFDKIVAKVCREYNEAVIKLIIPVAHFDPHREWTIKRAADKCSKEVTKAGVKLMILHDFVTQDELMMFLSSNSLNLFLYDPMHGRGISSALDYAISSGRPLGISKSYMFRHVWCDAIDAEAKTCEELMQSGSDWVRSIDCQANNDNIRKKIKHYI